MRKLSNDELATRVRESNRRRGQRQRERLTIAGRSPLTVWVPTGLRTRFTNEAAALGVSINELAERYLGAGLGESKLLNFTSSPDPDPQSDTADLFATAEPQTPVVVSTPDTRTQPSVCTDRDELMTAIGAMVDAGMSGAEIARRLNADGQRTAKGAEFNGANLLRDFRKWTEKQSQ